MSSSELYALNDVHLDELLQHVIDSKGSELHLLVGHPPAVRVRGTVKEITAYQEFSASVLQRMVNDILTDEQIRFVQSGSELQLDYSTADATARYDANIFHRVNGDLAAIFTLISSAA